MEEAGGTSISSFTRYQQVYDSSFCVPNGEYSLHRDNTAYEGYLKLYKGLNFQKDNHQIHIKPGNITENYKLTLPSYRPLTDSALFVHSNGQLYWKDLDLLGVPHDDVKISEGGDDVPIPIPSSNFSMNNSTFVFPFGTEALSCPKLGTHGSPITLTINKSTGVIKTLSSSKKYKDNIRVLEIDTRKVYDLCPVTFEWKDDKNQNTSFGLIAEDVDKILPELVEYDEEDLPEGVNYIQLSVLLLSEVKKLRKELDELKNQN